MGAIEGVGYSTYGGRARMATSGTRMEIIELDTESLAAVEVVEKGGVGLGGLLGFLLGEIDKVRAVWEDMATVLCMSIF